MGSFLEGKPSLKNHERLDDAIFLRLRENLASVIDVLNKS